MKQYLSEVECTWRC